MNANRQGSLLDFLWAFTERFPTCVDEYETLLTDNQNLETTYSRYWRCFS